MRNHAAEVRACDFLQVADLFFRSLFAFFLIELRVAEGDLRECNAIFDGSLGGAYLCGRRRRMGKRQHIYFGIMIAHSGRVSHV